LLWVERNIRQDQRVDVAASKRRGVAQEMLITETNTTLPLEGTGKRLPEEVKKISAG
jgi:hypothetical protein